MMQYRYRGVMCTKSPMDMAIYFHLLHEIRPGAFIEIGTKEGGSALLFADLLKAWGYDTQVVTIDRAPPPAGLQRPGIRYLRGNVLDIAATFAQHGLHDLPRPWVLCDDSAHSYTACMTVLDFAAQHLLPGDMLIVEDAVLEELDLADRFDGGPSRALREWLPAHPGIFEVATDLCDMFGQNATTNANGYLRRL